MKNETTTTTEPIQAQPTTTATSRDGGMEKYTKPLMIAAGVIVLLVAGWVGYKKMIVEPKEANAADEIFMAENLFDKMAAMGFNRDSSVMVLNGGTLDNKAFKGVLKVISDYGNTEAGNRARYIAGATYLQLKEYDKAITHLSSFKANGAHQVESKAYLMLGHAYAELNKTKEALDNYKKAANVNKQDETITPEALFIAGCYADAIENAEEAKKLFIELRDNFPTYTSVRSGDVDKYLASLGELK